ncbi:MAG TPA: transcriptional regulator [Candidatus Methylomirabilis sp.]|nr:transcriptional regulator [Candidatus Methylomirabilis sp.]
MADPGAARRREHEARHPGRAPAPRPRPARVDGSGLDSLVHHRLRLGIVSALGAAGTLSFNELKALLKTTDGNLSAHCRKLEEAEYIVCIKSFDGRRPRTDYRLAQVGRRELGRYLNHMEALIRATRGTLAR